MKHYSQIKPISYLKAHASEIVRTLREQGAPLIITQRGEAKVVVQDIESFEKTRETMALLKILALGNRQVEVERGEAATDVIAAQGSAARALTTLRKQFSTVKRRTWQIMDITVSEGFDSVRRGLITHEFRPTRFLRSGIQCIE